jgi:hypothetical protein
VIRRRPIQRPARGVLVRARVVWSRVDGRGAAWRLFFPLPLSARQPLVLPSKLPPNQREREVGLARGAKLEVENEGDLSSRPRTTSKISSVEPAGRPAGPYIKVPPRPPGSSRHFDRKKHDSSCSLRGSSKRSTELEETRRPSRLPATFQKAEVLTDRIDRIRLAGRRGSLRRSTRWASRSGASVGA